MAISERERKIRMTACPGCRNDRYNHPGIDDGGAPVTSEKCRLIETVKYDRASGQFVCPYWNALRAYRWQRHPEARA